MMTAITPIFSIDKITHENETIAATLNIDKNSEIFDGHFPGQPVVPGASMLQLVKDVLERAVGKPVFLKKAVQLKFISLIDPRTSSQGTFAIVHTTDKDEMAVTAQLHCNGSVCFKFQGTFTTQ